MKYVLWNPLANSSHAKESLDALMPKLEGAEAKSLLELEVEPFFASLKEDDEVYLLGGDGTINHLINDLHGRAPETPIYLYASGTGNDFLNDVKDHEKGEFVLLNPYMRNLPKVRVNGKEYFFINGIGFGIDGYCCEVGDDKRAKGSKKINYTSIAILGLLFHYKRVNATVEVDGVVETYKKVWLAPTMKGRYYGGGMMVAPSQDRSKDGVVTNVVFRGSSKLKTLLIFKTIFTGEHIKYKKMAFVRQGKKIKVTFDKPTALQIDGETVRNVLTYEVEA